MDLHSSIQVFRVRCRDVGVELMLPVEEEDQDSATVRDFVSLFFSRGCGI